MNISSYLDLETVLTISISSIEFPVNCQCIYDHNGHCSSLTETEQYVCTSISQHFILYLARPDVRICEIFELHLY